MIWGKYWLSFDGSCNIYFGGTTVILLAEICNGFICVTRADSYPSSINLIAVKDRGKNTNVGQLHHLSSVWLTRSRTRRGKTGLGNHDKWREERERRCDVIWRLLFSIRPSLWQDEERGRGRSGKTFVWSKLQRCLDVFFSFSQRRDSPVFYDFVSLIYEIVVFFFCHQCLKKFPGKKDDKGSYDCGRQVSIVNSGRCVWGMHPAHLCVGMQVKARGRVSWNCWCWLCRTLFVITCHLCVCVLLFTSASLAAGACVLASSIIVSFTFRGDRSYVVPTPNGCPLA